MPGCLRWSIDRGFRQRSGSTSETNVLLDRMPVIHRVTTRHYDPVGHPVGVGQGRDAWVQPRHGSGQGKGHAGRDAVHGRTRLRSREARYRFAEGVFQSIHDEELSKSFARRWRRHWRTAIPQGRERPSRVDDAREAVSIVERHIVLCVCLKQEGQDCRRARPGRSRDRVHDLIDAGLCPSGARRTGRECPSARAACGRGRRAWSAGRRSPSSTRATSSCTCVVCVRSAS